MKTHQLCWELEAKEGLPGEVRRPDAAPNVTALSFKTITQSIEKDWLVVLSDGDSAWLTSTNSIMTQIDLTSSTAAPAVTGFIFSYFKKQF